MIVKNGDYLKLYGDNKGSAEKLLFTKSDLETEKTEIDLQLNSGYNFIQFFVDILSAKIAIKDAILNCCISSIDSVHNSIFEVYEFDDPEIQSIIKYNFDEDFLSEANNKLIALYLKVNVRKEYNSADKLPMLGIKFNYEFSLMNKKGFDSNKNEEIKVANISRYKPNWNLQPKLIRLPFDEALSLVKSLM